MEGGIERRQVSIEDRLRQAIFRPETVSLDERIRLQYQYPEQWALMKGGCGETASCPNLSLKKSITLTSAEALKIADRFEEIGKSLVIIRDELKQAKKRTKKGGR